MSCHSLSSYKFYELIIVVLCYQMLDLLQYSYFFGNSYKNNLLEMLKGKENQSFQ